MIHKAIDIFFLKKLSELAQYLLNSPEYNHRFIGIYLKLLIEWRKKFK